MVPTIFWVGFSKLQDRNRNFQVKPFRKLRFSETPKTDEASSEISESDRSVRTASPLTVCFLESNSTFFRFFRFFFFNQFMLNYFSIMRRDYLLFNTSTCVSQCFNVKKKLFNVKKICLMSLQLNSELFPDKETYFAENFINENLIFILRVVN
jgi:hypothetical protein